MHFIRRCSSKTSFCYSKRGTLWKLGRCLCIIIYIEILYDVFSFFSAGWCFAGCGNIGNPVGHWQGMIFFTMVLLF